MLSVTLLLIWIFSVKQVFIIWKQILSLVRYCHAHLLDCSTAVTLLPLVCPQCSSRVPHHCPCPLPCTMHLPPRYKILNSFPVTHRSTSRRFPPPAHKLPHQKNAPNAAVDTVDYSVHCGSLLYQTGALTSYRWSLVHDGASSQKLWLVQTQLWFFATLLPEWFDLKYNKSHSHIWPLIKQEDEFKTEKKTQQLVNFQNLLI